MSKVFKQLFREELAEAERRGPRLRLVPPPPPPPHFADHFKKPVSKKKKAIGPTPRLYFLFSMFLMASAVSLWVNSRPAPISTSGIAQKKPKRNSLPSGVEQGAQDSSPFKLNAQGREPEDSELNAEGVRLFRAKSYKEAAAIFSELVENDASKPEWLINLGMTQMKLGDLKSSKATFMKALKLSNPVIPINENLPLSIVYNNLGSISLQEKNWGQAIHYFERSIQINPDYTEGRLNLAKAFELSGRPVEAAKEYANYLADAKVNDAVKPMIRKRLAKINTFVGYFTEEKPDPNLEDEIPEDEESISD